METIICMSSYLRFLKSYSDISYLLVLPMNKLFLHIYVFSNSQALNLEKTHVKYFLFAKNNNYKYTV